MKRNLIIVLIAVWVFMKINTEFLPELSIPGAVKGSMEIILLLITVYGLVSGILLQLKIVTPGRLWGYSVIGGIFMGYHWWLIVPLSQAGITLSPYLMWIAAPLFLFTALIAEIKAAQTARLTIHSMMDTNNGHY